MATKRPTTIAVNLYVPAEAIRAIDRWLGWRVYRGEITLGEASRSAEVERVIAGEAARVRRLKGTRPTEPLQRTEGEVVQVNQRLPAEIIETIDAYAKQQQADHGHSSGSVNRSKLIYAALVREAERLTAELARQEREWIAERSG